MSRLLHTLEKIASLLTKYIGLIIICFSVLAFFWRDGFAWTTTYTSVFLGVAMFGMGLTIHMGDFKVVFTRPKEVILGFIAQYTLMPVIAWLLATAFHLPADLALGVILVGCCPGGTASNVITYIAGGDVALSVGMTIASTLAATADDTAAGIPSCRCMGGSFLLQYGNFGGKGRSDPGTPGHFSAMDHRQAD